MGDVIARATVAVDADISAFEESLERLASRFRRAAYDHAKVEQLVAVAADSEKEYYEIESEVSRLRGRQKDLSAKRSHAGRDIDAILFAGMSPYALA